MRHPHEAPPSGRHWLPLGCISVLSCLGPGRTDPVVMHPGRQNSLDASPKTIPESIVTLAESGDTWRPSPIVRQQDPTSSWLSDGASTGIYRYLYAVPVKKRKEENAEAWISGSGRECCARPSSNLVGERPMPAPDKSRPHLRLTSILFLDPFPQDLNPSW